MVIAPQKNLFWGAITYCVKPSAELKYVGYARNHDDAWDQTKKDGIWWKSDLNHGISKRNVVSERNCGMQGTKEDKNEEGTNLNNDTPEAENLNNEGRTHTNGAHVSGEVSTTESSPTCQDQRRDKICRPMIWLRNRYRHCTAAKQCSSTFWWRAIRANWPDKLYRIDKTSVEGLYSTATWLAR